MNRHAGRQLFVVGLFMCTTNHAVDAATISASQNATLTDGLVGLWSFDRPDVSGTTAYGRSGQGNNGMLTGGPMSLAGTGQLVRRALQAPDEREVLEFRNEFAVNGDQFHAKLLRKSDMQGVVERQLVATRQTDHGLGHLGGGRDQVKLKIVEAHQSPLDFGVRKAGVVEQHVADFIDQEVWGREWGMADEMSIPQLASLDGIGFVHEPLQGDRRVNDRPYRDSRSLRMTLTLSQPGGAFRRKRSIAATARSIRAGSRTHPLRSHSTTFIIATNSIPCLAGRQHSAFSCRLIAEG